MQAFFQRCISKYQDLISRIVLYVRRKRIVVRLGIVVVLGYLFFFGVSVLVVPLLMVLFFIALLFAKSSYDVESLHEEKKFEDGVIINKDTQSKEDSAEKAIDHKEGGVVVVKKRGGEFDTLIKIFVFVFVVPGIIIFLFLIISGILGYTDY